MKNKFYVFFEDWVPFLSVIFSTLAIGLLIGVCLGTNLKLENKFCPECGRRYHNAEYCVQDGNKLKNIDYGE